MGREHVIDPARIHHVWDRSLAPAIVVRSGDTVHYDVPMAGHGQVREGATIDEVTFDFATIYNLSGPVYLEGAEPGDTLEIEILALEPGEWGWTVFLPGLGLLAEDFPEGYLKTWNLRRRDRAELVSGVEVPFAPFFGTMGTATDEPGEHLPFPPHKGGGNMDNRHLTAGSTLWLPVWCDGALFSCGDPHAAQGDGEVCVSAIECPMRASLRFHLNKRTIDTPRFRVPGPLTPRTDPGGYFATMGIAPDLMDGARKAVRAMIGWLVEEHGLTREDAYVLTSVAGDLKILEVVDAGVWNVSMTMPLDVFAAAA
jgi:acetamidase/formamidase